MTALECFSKFFFINRGSSTKNTPNLTVFDKYVTKNDYSCVIDYIKDIIYIFMLLIENISNSWLFSKIKTFMYSILKLACNIKDRVSTFSSGRNINEINVKTKAID